MQISYSIRGKVQAADNIRTDKSGYRKDATGTVRAERNRNSGGGVLRGACPYVGADTAEVQRVGNNGIFEREKQSDDIRPAFELKIQVRQPTLLV